MNLLDPSRAKKLVEDSGFKKRYIASRCGITVNTLYPMLRGVYKTKPAVLIKLAVLLNTNTDYLTGKSDDSRPYIEAA